MLRYYQTNGPIKQGKYRYRCSVQDAHKKANESVMNKARLWRSIVKEMDRKKQIPNFPMCKCVEPKEFCEIRN